MRTRHLQAALFIILALLSSGCSHQPTPGLRTPVEQTPTSKPAPPPQPTPKPSHGQGRGSDALQELDFDIPAHSLDVILGRPTAGSITLSLLAYSDQTISIAYGTESGHYTSRIDPVSLQGEVPQRVQLSNLQPDTAYFYTVNGGKENTFHTARPMGSTFTFTIQTDSHLDSNTDPQVYLQALANQRADRPDFVMDLGDTFMTDKYKPYTDAAPQYLAQRYFLGQLADTAPLFLVLGNHDGEGAARGNNGAELSDWAAGMRMKYFPNPVPDGFYTGDLTPDPALGGLQDYYAFTWGGALFVVLDPYWFTPPARGDTTHLWNPTLGAEQYQWLKTALETSDARWKFVFIHQLIGGTDRNGRGGVEVAPLYEWGGNNPDGTYGFDEQRPGWGMPIHPLLVASQVTAVFHGHDHLFVKQELDGVIYQECPQPGIARTDTDKAVEYGYISGDVVAGSGHLRVTVSPERVTVDFVRASLSPEENGQVATSYVIEPVQVP